jgi:hypothetical protein
MEDKKSMEAEENKTDVADALEIEEKPLETEDKGDDEKIVKEFRSISRRNFLGFGIGGILAGGAYYWLRSAPLIGGLESPLRHTLQFNEVIARKFFSHSRLAPEYPKSAVEPLRVNGGIGLSNEFDASNWKLNVSGINKSPNTTLQFTLEDIKKLPKQNISINFKCIEGWSRIMNYVGARFSDFIGQNNLLDENNLPEYVSLATPDGKYYVGLDIESALHPQTLLCYEMNGDKLKPEHGYPLRLLIPTKYGIKNLKRIGTIKFTNERPKDYWAERGYDWYAGL